jgi:hypothetical protein
MTNTPVILLDLGLFMAAILSRTWLVRAALLLVGGKRVMGFGGLTCVFGGKNGKEKQTKAVYRDPSKIG